MILYCGLIVVGPCTLAVTMVIIRNYWAYVFTNDATVAYLTGMVLQFCFAFIVRVPDLPFVFIVCCEQERARETETVWVGVYVFFFARLQTRTTC